MWLKRINEKRPPIGVAPHWLVNLKRIEELNDAIKRLVEELNTNCLSETDIKYYKLVAKYAEEVRTLAEMEARLTKFELRRLERFYEMRLEQSLRAQVSLL